MTSLFPFDHCSSRFHMRRNHREVKLEPLASSPTAFVIDGFATAEECAALVSTGGGLPPSGC